MEEALLRILTPKRSIDILRDVHAAKEQGRPYVVVFVGVNGVGKSTNLAKVLSFRCFLVLQILKRVYFSLSINVQIVNMEIQVAYWLLQHDVSVMLAACDTFRSGAVEQLRTHARRLQVHDFG
jgi:signal recognition particle receptor subunit alpha